MEINKPITVVLSPISLNVILAALDQLPHGKVRPVYADLESQVVEQLKGKSDESTTD